MKITTSRSTQWKRFLLILILVFAAPLLSGCSDFEWDFFWYLAEEWSLAEGIYDGENIIYEKMGEEIANDAFDSFFGGPDQVALEANNVVDDIRQADALVERASAEAATGGLQQGLVLVDQAIQLRPSDYTYVQRRAAMQLRHDKLDAYDEDTMAAYKVMENAIKNGQDCKLAHRNFYQQQLAALQTQAPTIAIMEQIGNVQLSLDHPENWPCK